MINLFDTYNRDAWDLHYSLLVSGYMHPTVVVTDDGFLPEDVTSPYLFFTGFETVKEGRPLYFNQVKVPDFWEIRGNHTEADIYDLHRKRAHIHYALPKHQRFVKQVDWFDEAGRIRVSDCYNRLGFRFSQITYHLDQQPVLTSYFSPKQEEIIVENHGTGTITLNYQNQIHLFKNKVDFVTFYLKKAGFELDRIFYNSLSTPFLVAYYLDLPGQDILFWQEGLEETLPGNMRLLLNQTHRPSQVMVQKPGIYNRMQPYLSNFEKAKVKELGFLYPFSKDDVKQEKQALLLTNSDQIDGLEDLLAQNTDLTIHIGAITEMSSHLLSYGRFDNVRLYPNITLDKVKTLLSHCDIYLDINHGNEILSSIRSAFEHHLLIFALDYLAHDKRYVSPNCLFSSSKDLLIGVRQLLDNMDQYSSFLQEQIGTALTETRDTFCDTLGGLDD